VIPAAAICSLIVAGIFREYSWFYHTGLIPIYVLGVLSFTPCGDGWSMDRLLRIMRGNVLPRDDAEDRRAVYGWSRYAVWTIIAVPYVAAAMSKLYYSGFAWLGADNMKATLLRTTLAPMEFDWTLSLDLLRGPDVIFVGLAVVGLFTELLFGLVLFSPKARRILPAAMALTHVGILFLQNILFIDLILLQAVFYDFTGLRRAVGLWVDACRFSMMGTAGSVSDRSASSSVWISSGSSTGAISGRNTSKSTHPDSSTRWRRLEAAGCNSGFSPIALWPGGCRRFGLCCRSCTSPVSLMSAMPCIDMWPSGVTAYAESIRARLWRGEMCVGPTGGVPPLVSHSPHFCCPGGSRISSSIRSQRSRCLLP
jgi:hypothetical protein